MIPTHLRSRVGDKPGGIFYLWGEDEFSKEEAARALVEAHLDPGTRDFNHDLLRGSDVDVERLASVLGTPPMMAEWRVVHLRETEALAGSPRARDVLLRVAASPPPGLALVLMSSEPRGSKAKFYTELRRKGRAIEFPRVPENDLPAWVIGWAAERLDRILEEPAARALAGAVGSDLSVLARELEKLNSMADTGAPITLELVKAGGTRVPRQDRWEWFDLVGERRFGPALEGLRILLGHGESGVGLTIALATHLLRLGLAAEGGARALQAALPPHQGWLSGRYVAQARRWDPAEIEAALEGLLRVDRLLKSSGFSDQELLEGWILERLVQEAAA